MLLSLGDIYRIPQAHLWWAAAGSGLRCALVALLDDLPADLPLLLLATAELPATDSEAAAAGAAGSSRRLLPGPSSTAAAAAAGRASTGANGQEQPGECLEELGLDPTLAALFPPLGCLSDLQGLLLPQTSQQDTGLPQAQQNPQGGLADHQQQQQLEQQCSQGARAAGHGRAVLGWVLLQPPGALERRKMFQASTRANAVMRISRAAWLPWCGSQGLAKVAASVAQAYLVKMVVAVVCRNHQQCALGTACLLLPAGYLGCSSHPTSA